MRRGLFLIMRPAAVLAALGALFYRAECAFVENTCLAGNLFSYFTIHSTVFLVIILITALCHPGKETEWLTAARAIATTYMVVSGATFGTMVVNADLVNHVFLIPLSSKMMHFVLPVYALFDFFFAPGRHRLHWRAAWAALIYPLAWTVYTLARGRMAGWYPYFFLDPGQVGGYEVVSVYASILAGFLLAVSFSVVAASRLLPAARSAGTNETPGGEARRFLPPAPSRHGGMTTAGEESEHPPPFPAMRESNVPGRGEPLMDLTAERTSYPQFHGRAWRLTAGVLLLGALTACDTAPADPSQRSTAPSSVQPMTDASPSRQPTAGSARTTPAPPVTPKASTTTDPTADALQDRWGSYQTQNDACQAMTDDVLVLALVPTHVKLGADSEGLRSIADKIERRGSAAPPEIAPAYFRALSALEEYRKHVDAQRNAGRSDTPDPEFNEEHYEAALDDIRAWISGTCSG